jgi:transcription elongation factor GreA
MTSTSELARFVREGRWSDLEEAWTTLILEDPAIPPALEAVGAAARRKEIPRCLALVREHADLLVSSDRPAEAAELLGEAMLQGGSPGELARPLFESAHAAWGAEPFWEAYSEIAELRENVPDMRAAWRAFRKLLSIAPGRVVYHAKGWGLGVIERTDPGQREATVRFTSGRSDRFPFQSAIDIFEFLDPSDLRCLVVSDPDELARRLSKEPLEVLRWILMRNGGKAPHAAIKLAMGTLGVDGARFTTWWRKTKKAAETSEWFELSGPPARVTVRMLDVATDPVQGIVRQIARAKSLGEALQRVRALSGGAVAPEVMAAALVALEQQATEDRHAVPHRLGTWLFLREQRGATPEAFREALAAVAGQPSPTDPSLRPDLWQLFSQVPGSRDQERCIEVLREVLGPDWLDVAATNLPHAAPGMVRGLVAELQQAGRTPELLVHYKALLARPTRNPILLVRLVESLEGSGHDDELPPPLPRAQCLLQLAVHLYRSSTGDTVLTRARTRLSDVLCQGSPALLRRLLSGATVDDLRGFASMLESGVDRDIDRLFTRIAVETSPDVYRGDERPFWEGSSIWTTRAGLARRQEELRVLREVKIPENAEAIGKAASFGDLSENSEWEAAIEDQRILTNRAMELENELRDAQLLENAMIPEGTVAPGTAVRYRELDAGDGAELRVELLGPWDLEGDHQISYRSPLAKGLLGRTEGDEATLELPAGSKRVQILGVEPLDLRP